MTESETLEQEAKAKTAAALPDAEENSAQKQDIEGATAMDDMGLSQSVDAENQYITFTINDEEYATPILTVQEIRGWMKTTPLPNTPVYVRGVTNLRGNIVPVFDLQARFQNVLTEVTDRHVVIMADIRGRTIGLLVDAISDILTIESDRIQPPPDASMTVETQYLDGLVTAGKRMVAIVNIAKLFDMKMIDELQQSPA